MKTPWCKKIRLITAVLGVLLLSPLIFKEAIFVMELA